MGSNQDTVRALYDAFGSGDVPTVLALLDDQIDWREPDSMPLDSQVGPQAVAENILGAVTTQIKDFRLAVDDIVGDEDVVCAIGGYHGTGATTGLELDTPFAHVFRFGPDGKITGFRTLTDTVVWRQVLGAD